MYKYVNAPLPGFIFKFCFNAQLLPTYFTIINILMFDCLLKNSEIDCIICLSLSFQWLMLDILYCTDPRNPGYATDHME